MNIAVIGMGYVGLPLAAEFSKKFNTIGFDINNTRIDELQNGFDRTKELSADELKSYQNLKFTGKLEDIAYCNIFIVTVPTPIDADNKPDLHPLISATNMVGDLLHAGDIVIYESTVFPGASEEVCVPILEQKSGLKYAPNASNEDEEVFHLGYSPERINPGDKEHRVTDIVKVTSGSTPEIAEFIDKLYGEVITAGTYKAESIKVAEAAKVIENTQRDVNIALVNELAVLFEKLNLDTEAVLNAAGTKWNFLPFRPGLVGGHCIGVDPYYLTYKAQQVGHNPEMILAGRRINDHMSQYTANRIISLMASHDIEVGHAKILVLGITFKENCPDTRNSKVVDMVNALSKINANIDIFDPRVSADDLPAEFQDKLVEAPENSYYDCIVLAVKHAEFLEPGIEKIRAFGKPGHVFFDLKYGFDASQSDGRL